VNGNGLDLKMVSFPVPAKVDAGQHIPVDINVAMVIIGNIGLPKVEAPKKNYDLTFHLVDDVDAPKEGVFISIFTQLIDCKGKMFSLSNLLVTCNLLNILTSYEHNEHCCLPHNCLSSFRN